MGEEGHCKVKINLDHHRRGEFVEMKKFDLLADVLFHQPALGVLTYYLLSLQVKVIGDNQSRFFFAVTREGQLTQWLAIALRGEHLLIDFEGASF